MIREGWYKRVAADLMVWVVVGLLCMLWRWIDDKSSIAIYWGMFGVLAVLWVLIGFVVQSYRSYKDAWLWQAMVSLVADAAIQIGLIWWVLPHLPYQLSPKVATWSVLIVGAIETVLVFAAHYWKYATNMTVPAMQIEQREQRGAHHAGDYPYR